MELSAYQNSGKVRHTEQKGNVADLPSLTKVINCERAERQWEGEIRADAFSPLCIVAVFVCEKEGCQCKGYLL